MIGRAALHVEEDSALRYVAAYCLMNDVSEREFQMEHGGGTTKGKSCDTFAPIGPWLVTADEIADPQALGLWTTVNGERRQQGSARDMVFPVRQLVSYVSRFMSLQPGDLLSTGTPAGRPGARPPGYLDDGDAVAMGSTASGPSSIGCRHGACDLSSTAPSSRWMRAADPHRRLRPDRRGRDRPGRAARDVAPAGAGPG